MNFRSLPSASPITAGQSGKHSKALVLGVSAALLSILCFSAMDAMVKWLGSDYSVIQIMFFRCTVALVPISFFLYRAGGVRVLRTNRPWMHALRSLLGMLAMTFAFYGFTVLPLADASAVFYMAPLIGTALSVPILGEHVGIRRWLAISIGFAGVLIITRPGGAVFNLGGLSMLIAAFVVGVNSTVVRMLSATDQAISITFYFTLSGAVLTTILCIFSDWVAPGGWDLVLLICVGLMGGMAQYALALSLRYAAVSIIAPFRYLSIVAGGIFGYLIWSEIPDSLTLLGIAIIIGCGLYSMHRETKLARQSDNRGKISDHDRGYG